MTAIIVKHNRPIGQQSSAMPDPSEFDHEPTDAELPALSTAPRRFPCQQCGAELQYAPGTRVLKCEYCSFENQIPQTEAEITELDFDSAIADLRASTPTQDNPVIKCDACGAQSTFPPNVTASACPFCGSKIVATGQSRNLIKPRSLLPFKITREKSLELFGSWLSSLWFAPSDLRQYALNDEKLRGVYLPHWTYDCRTSSFYRGQRGDDYWVTVPRTVMVNGRSQVRMTRERRTRWRSVSGTVGNRFDDVLVPASKSLPQDDLIKLEPWDLKALAPYDDAYLSGFIAESYQVDLAQGFTIAQSLMDPVIRQTVCRDIGGDHQRIDSLKTQYAGITFKHILLPVWLSAYRYRGRLFRFMVNARTGEIFGQRPYSAWKIALVVLAGLVVVALIALFTQRR